MKKILAMFIIAAAFAACNNESEAGPESIKNADTTPMSSSSDKMTGKAGAPKMDDSTDLLGDTTHMMHDTLHKH